MQGTAASLLRDRREELGLTQWEVSRRAGVREYDISRWERGKTRTLPLLGMWKVCRVLGIDIEDLADALLADEASAADSDPRDPPTAREDSASQAGARAAKRAAPKQQPRRSRRPPGA